MSRQLRCRPCGGTRFRKVQESVIELYAWSEGDAEYAREERVPDSAIMSTFACERCGSRTPISPGRWVRLVSAESLSAAAEGLDDYCIHVDDLKGGVSVI
jgi:hypothetical protein